MTKENFHVAITVNVSAKEVMEKISEVDKWWATNVTGNTTNIFTVRFGKTFSTIKAVETIFEKKIVWIVLDCDLPLFKNPKEWLNTKLIWNISEDKNMTHIEFIHEGLTSDLDCWEDCKKGWTYYICESLQKLIAEGKGMPGTGIFSYIIFGERRYEGLLYFKGDSIPDYEEGFLYVDVLETKGEQVTNIHSVGDYLSKDFNPQNLMGEYYMIIGDKYLSKNIAGDLPRLR